MTRSLQPAPGPSNGGHQTCRTAGDRHEVFVQFAGDCSRSRGTTLTVRPAEWPSTVPESRSFTSDWANDRPPVGFGAGTVGAEGNAEFSFVFRGLVVLATWRDIDGESELRDDFRQRICQHRVRVPGLSEDIAPWNRAILGFRMALPPDSRIALYWC